MLEPQSTALFILLMAAFFALLAWVALTKQPALRVLAAALAFVPAMLFGVAAVNKFYNYYQSWGAVMADLGGQGVSAAASIPPSVSTKRLTAILSRVTADKLAAQQGETVALTVTGRLSGIARLTYLYFPPQYFQRAYRNFRFPAIELINGYPGQPQDWINVADITQSYLTLLQDKAAKPAVLVMPDPNGGPRISLQCLNVVHGPQDATFLGVDLQNALSRELRVQPTGKAWGVAGYSEGGFCAANLALLYPARYGAAGVMSGYFRPYFDQIGPRKINPFGKNPTLRKKNTPLDRVNALPVFVHFAKFWLGAGSGNRQDVRAVLAFQRQLVLRQPTAPLQFAAGGGHSMGTWRALIPPMLIWMTQRLYGAALHPAAHVVHKASPLPSTRVQPASSNRSVLPTTSPAPTAKPSGKPTRKA